MATRYPGVKKLEPRVFEIRARIKDPRTGVEKTIKKRLRDVTARQAAAELERLKAEARAGRREGERERHAGRTTLGDYSKRWIDAGRLRGLKYRTLAERVDVLRLHILPQ